MEKQQILDRLAPYKETNLIINTTKEISDYIRGIVYPQNFYAPKDSVYYLLTGSQYVYRAYVKPFGYIQINENRYDGMEVQEVQELPSTIMSEPYNPLKLLNQIHKRHPHLRKKISLWSKVKSVFKN